MYKKWRSLLAGSSLIALLDDIATLLDDIAVLSKVGVKKTAGVLGDDLALNAEQVSGVRADRELPVVWAVAKGSLLNKVILVPAALLISAFVPSLITVLLVIGGLFLCYEGAEKLADKFIHSPTVRATEHKEKLAAFVDKNVDLVALEKDKIKGAIRTDFILSAEIVVIVLGTLQDATFQMQVMVLSGLAFLITAGVYGFVAAIVKIDDLGLYLLHQSISGSFSAIKKGVGRGLLIFAPFLMKFLSIAGTVAMFLVGGGILTHSFGSLHHLVSSITVWTSSSIGNVMTTITPTLLDGVFGIVAGLIVLGIVIAGKKLKSSI